MTPCLHLVVAALCLAVSAPACEGGDRCPHAARVCLIPGVDVPRPDTGAADATVAEVDATAPETVDDTVATTDVADTATAPDTLVPDTIVDDTIVDDTLVADTGIDDTVVDAEVIVSCGPGSYEAGGGCVPCAAVSECIGVVSCTGAGDSRCSQCRIGFEQLADGAACSDIDECQSDRGGCDDHATCNNVPGGRTCVCDAPTYAGDGITCTLVPCSNTPTGATILGGYVDGGAFTVGATPRATAVGDIDGDGVPDVVTDSNASSGPGAISVRVGDGAGGFCRGADFDAGDGGYGLVLLDANRDGRLDVAVSSFDSGDVRVLLNTTQAAGAPTFAGAVAFATAGGSSAIAVGNFNGDGGKDLVTANFKAGVTVLLNTTPPFATTPTFSTSSLTAGTQPNGAAVADFDRDGRDDIAIANYSALQVGSASIFINRTPALATTPTFDAPLTLAAGAGPDGIAAGDLDEDGAPDVVVANQGEATVSVFLNRLAHVEANFTLGAKHVVTTTGNQTAAVTIADVDGDTHLDVVATTRYETTISYGVGDGTLEPAVSLVYLATSGPLWTSVADVDGDALLDFVIAQPGLATGNVWVVLRE